MPKTAQSQASSESIGANSYALHHPRPWLHHYPLRSSRRDPQAMAALWNGPEDRSASIIKPSTVERLESFTSGCNVGLISASRSDLTMEVNSRRWVDLYAYIWPRFGSLDVDVRFSEHGTLHA